ncbi:S-glutathionyl-(chloro)hydroquinone reductase [Neophaeococcomyces mojaviensis]|uniref:S-glutathionyl-(Chloro)hydroquinone reductase n=1 Tax=Neophaeococcomyces mojaviensis TaxID=3383035 RepID=A0ACC3AI58_9EURO|nr:S-glutathionyl-(chloro)hydroquinone reductase [Knufia sp. JES_112]
MTATTNTEPGPLLSGLPTAQHDGNIQSTAADPLPAKLFNEKGELQRPASQFRNWISRVPGARFSPEKGRYHLYVSYACPWAHRTLIVRKLKGLEEVIGVTVVHWHMSMVDSWRFVREGEDQGEDIEGKRGEDTNYNVGPDPLHIDQGVERLPDLYRLAMKGGKYEGRFTVPVLWDKKEETIVSNESSEILRMLDSEFEFVEGVDATRYKSVDLYPKELRQEIDEANAWMYERVNNGVYRCGMAKTQTAYHTAMTELFSSLDRIEEHLSSVSSSGPYYFGNTLTEVDVRLYVTIVRFDPVYVNIFKTNKAMIRTGYPAIHKWLKGLYWNEKAFGGTTNMRHIKGHYFESLTVLNPSGIVPEGPIPNVVGLDER